MNNGLTGARPTASQPMRAESLRDARARLLSVYADLPESYWIASRFPYREIINPPLWEIAHVAWFQEYWCLRYDPEQDRAIRPSIFRNADELFDSRRVAHKSRWNAEYPAKTAIDEYLCETLSRIESDIESGATADPARDYFVRLSLHHEQMHAEALLMTLRTLGLPLPPTFPHLPELSKEKEWVAVAEGRYPVGTERSAAHFVFDNEKFVHDVEVGAFQISSRPVLAEEFADFVSAGGYSCNEFWSLEGIAWRDEHRKRQLGADSLRRVNPNQRHQPACNVSLHEARAYCKWAGCRLPLEVEWEIAARQEGGLGLAGLVWEWTDSAFGPFPGFSADPYREYSQPWFGDHYVLRGGSWLTHPDLKRPGFRNFYLPHRDDVFAGFRTCAV